jgi:prevent-host-death family protein
MIDAVTSIEAIDMIREAPAMTVRQKLGELLNEIQYRGDSVVITKSGKPVAALIDIALFERLRTLDDEYARLRGDLAHAFSKVPPHEGMALIDEAVEAARGLG